MWRNQRLPELHCPIFMFWVRLFTMKHLDDESICVKWHPEVTRLISIIIGDPSFFSISFMCHRFRVHYASLLFWPLCVWQYKYWIFVKTSLSLCPHDLWTISCVLFAAPLRSSPPTSATTLQLLQPCAVCVRSVALTFSHQSCTLWRQRPQHSSSRVPRSNCQLHSRPPSVLYKTCSPPMTWTSRARCPQPTSQCPCNWLLVLSKVAPV